MILSVAIIGFKSGSITFVKAPNIVAPSILAASSKDGGIWLMNPAYITVENGISSEKYKIVSPENVSLSPILLHIVINGITVTVPGIMVENMIKANAILIALFWHLANP